MGSIATAYRDARPSSQPLLQLPERISHRHGRRYVASLKLAHGVLLVEANGARPQAQDHGDLLLLAARSPEQADAQRSQGAST